MEGSRKELGAIADEFKKNPALANDPAALKSASARIDAQTKGLDENQRRILQNEPSFAAVSKIPALETYRAAHQMQQEIKGGSTYGKDALTHFAKDLDTLSPAVRKAIETECPGLTKQLSEATKGLIRRGGEVVVREAEAVQGAIDSGVKKFEHSAGRQRGRAFRGGAGVGPSRRRDRRCQDRRGFGRVG